MKTMNISSISSMVREKLNIQPHDNRHKENADQVQFLSLETNAPDLHNGGKGTAKADPPSKSESFNDDSHKSRCAVLNKDVNTYADSAYPCGEKLPPLSNAPQPITNFRFSFSEIREMFKYPNDIDLDDIENLCHIGNGSSSNILSGLYNNKRVIIKMLMHEFTKDELVLQEFDIEYAILCRVDHPNIIKVVGSGSYPRKFIVMDELDSTLETNPINANTSKRNLFYANTSSNLIPIYSKARDIASAMDYLHTQIHPNATVIHRDLKPDNIGFNHDGEIQIFDFGLSTCVRRRNSSDEVYAMSGNTGSLRFMAPEVALHQPYSEKADVYSFGIILWQMASEKLAFKNMTKKEFMLRVAKGGERPKLFNCWSRAFCSLLVSCWSTDPEARPTFESILDTLDLLIRQASRQTRVTPSLSTSPAVSPQIRPKTQSGSPRLQLPCPSISPPFRSKSQSVTPGLSVDPTPTPSTLSPSRRSLSPLSPGGASSRAKIQSQGGMRGGKRRVQGAVGKTSTGTGTRTGTGSQTTGPLSPTTGGGSDGTKSWVL